MILVTGGTGMAGSFIVQELKRRGYELRVLARAESAEIAQRQGADVAIGDLSDVGSLRRAAQGVSGIVHVANTFKDPDVDTEAMSVLLEVWDKGPFVFISTVDVYGYPKWLPVTEEHPRSGDLSDYARGKVQCEERLEAAARERDRTDFSILRPPHIWGPHPRCRERLVSPAIQKGTDIVLPGETPEEWRQFEDAWADTRELAWVATECLDRPLGGAANVITGHFNWHDVYSELIQLTGSTSRVRHMSLEMITDMKAETNLPNAPQFYAQRWQYSREHLEQHLDFQASHQWQETLAEIVSLVPAAEG